MANRSTDLRTAVRDDRAVAGVVGFVLILAAGITYYSWAAQTDVPRVGAENERAWDADVGAALARLANSAGARAGTDASVREIVPPAPEAPTQTMPFLAPLRSARAAGSLEFAESCGGATLTHLGGAVLVVDLDDGAHGCITFRGETAYADAFTYRIELGGVLRIQSDQALVLAGPPLDVGASHVALTLLQLDGYSQTLGVDRANAPVSFAPRPGALEVGSLTNANGIEWRLTTNYPEAWKEWYQGRFDAVGVTATSGYTCATPTATGPARGPCEVVIVIPDPTSLSISYGRYEVDLG